MLVLCYFTIKGCWSEKHEGAFIVKAVAGSHRFMFYELYLKESI